MPFKSIYLDIKQLLDAKEEIISRCDEKNIENYSINWNFLQNLISLLKPFYELITASETSISHVLPAIKFLLSHLDKYMIDSHPLSNLATDIKSAVYEKYRGLVDDDVDCDEVYFMATYLDHRYLPTLNLPQMNKARSHIKSLCDSCDDIHTKDEVLIEPFLDFASFVEQQRKLKIQESKAQNIDQQLDSWEKYCELGKINSAEDPFVFWFSEMATTNFDKLQKVAFMVLSVPSFTSEVKPFVGESQDFPHSLFEDLTLLRINKQHLMSLK